MSKRIEIKHGEKYFYLELTGREEIRGKNRNRFVECLCVCGKLKFVRLAELRFGACKSCGCKMPELVSVGKTKHGLAKNGRPHPLYEAWANMRARCNRKTSTRYKRYGGRGIKICKEWDDFKVFYDWAIGLGWKKGLTVEREDVDGDYEPNNCTLIPLADQGKNTSRIRPVEAFGESKSLAEWSRDYRCIVGAGTLRSRFLAYKWKLEESLTTPLIPAGHTKNKKCGN